MKELTQKQKQIFNEIPELLDQLDALMEFYPLPSPVWKDIRKLMILSYDKGHRDGYDDGHSDGYSSGYDSAYYDFSGD